MDNERQSGDNKPKSDPRRKQAGALAAVFAGAWLAQIAAMIFSKPGKNKKDK